MGVGYGVWGIRVLSDSGPVRGVGRGQVNRKRYVCMCLSQRVTKRTRTNEREQLPNEKEQISERKPESMQWNKWNGTQKYKNKHNIELKLYVYFYNLRFMRVTIVVVAAVVVVFLHTHTHTVTHK